MKVLTLISSFLLIFQYSIQAGELVFRGIYQGKDVYIQNPYSESAQTYCTESVYVNGNKVITNPNTSAFRINLSALNVSAPVEIRIIHRDDCTPRIINPEVIKPASNFQFETARVSRKSISWLVKGELPGGQFIIERKLPEKEWEDIHHVAGKGNILSGNYEMLIKHEEGVNNYRIRFEGPGRQPVYSEEISLEYHEAPVTFSPYYVIARITLSREVEYEITDKQGNSYLEGKGDLINVRDLPPGEYILHFQDRQETFVKEPNQVPKTPIKKKDNKKGNN